MPPSFPRAIRLTLLLVVGLGIVLRVVALDFGQGLLHARPDEFGVVETLRSIRTGRLFPMHLAYGGGYHAPLYVFTRLVARDADLVTATTAGYLRLELAARHWSALLSIATLGLVYVLGRRLGGARTGLVAAAILASSTLAVREAHFAKADTAAGFAATLALVALVHPRRRPVTIGAATGLAVATKYLVGFLPAVLLALCEGARATSGRVAAAMVCALVAGAVFLVLDPFWVTSPRLAWTYLATVARSQWLFTDLAGFAGTTPGPLRYHATLSLRFGCGLAFAMLAAPALVMALVRPGATRLGPACLVAIGVLGHVAVLLTNPLVVARNLLPAVPALSALVAHLLMTAIGRLSPRARRYDLLVLAATLAIVVEPLADATHLVRLLATPDTRTLASTWIAERLPAVARIATVGAPYPGMGFGLPALDNRHVADRLPPERWQSEGITHVVWHHYPLPYSSEPLPAAASGLTSLAVFHPFDGPTRDPILEPLDAFYLPLAHFAGIARPGPRVEIFALGPPP
jgi:hypothetical protein